MKEEKPFICIFASAGNLVPGKIQNGIMYNQKMILCFSRNLSKNHCTLYQKRGLIKFSDTE